MPQSEISEKHETDDKRVCSDCVGEAYLKAHIQRVGKTDDCSYCNRKGQTIGIEQLADIIERTFEAHYVRTDTEPDGLEYAMQRDPEIEYEWKRSGDKVLWAIASAADIDEDVAEDIRLILYDRSGDFDSWTMREECPFSENSHYEQKSPDDGEFPYLWNTFQSDLKTKSRFFSRSAHGILNQIFEGIQDLRTTSGTPVVVSAGPSCQIDHLFRARVFSKEDGKLREALEFPWKHLGTPPSEHAGAGRMNARGIAVFYGALDAETAVKEVRPPVGSKVAVARFILIRPVKLLDLNALMSIDVRGSIFDPATIIAMQKGSFLEILSRMMSRAIMPHEEASEYLPTQAVADYLGNEVRIDGMIFPSVQAGHLASNIVLFHHASRVEVVKIPDGATVKGSLEFSDSDGVHTEYRVWEDVGPEKTQGYSPPESTPMPVFETFDLSEHFDQRGDTLKIELDSIEVRHIRSVSFDAEPHTVTRHRLRQADLILNSTSGNGSDGLLEDSDNPFE